VSAPAAVAVTARNPDAAPVLRVEDLTVRYPGPAHTEITVVDGVSLDIHRGETLGLVGESGCGKSTLAKAILQLVPVGGGRVVFDGHDLGSLSAPQLRRLRSRLQVVFQDPRGSLDPRMRVDGLITEVLKLHRLADRRVRRQRAAELLAEVGLDPSLADRRPGHLSGGQQQRVALARAIAAKPDLVVLDEPVSALDVSVQAQVINLLQELQENHHVAYLFIAHNLAVVRHLSHWVAVMYLGRIVELAPVHNLFAKPVHPYTKALIASVLPPDEGARERLNTARRLSPGEVPSPANVPSGCRYHPRCPFADIRCRTEEPKLRQIEGDHSEGHRVACHHWRTVARTLTEVRAR
jgi:oligopeptide/dipeptide ABC transporter ATP-binding protein